MPVAIEFVSLPDPFVEVGDTLRLRARVLDRGGDTIPGATIVLAVVDTAYLALDSADFAVIGKAPAPAAKVIALAGTLKSGALTIRVPAGHADSLALAGPAADTLAPTDSAAALSALVLDLTTTPGTPTPLADRPVRFSVVDPVFPRADTATVRFANDSLGQTVRTGVDGTAAVTLRRRRGVQPDSAVVQAVATRSSGAPLSGSPVRFVVRFQ